MEDRVFGIGVIIFLAFIAWIVVHSWKEDSRLHKLCVAQHGTWYHPYKSDGICLPKGSVINLGE